jgi:hypothetical protein
MNLSDIVSYCKSKQSKTALLFPDEHIRIVGPKGTFLDSGINISEDQIDSLVLAPLDVTQTSELNENGYINFYLTVGTELLSLRAFIDQGKIRAIIDFVDGFSPDQTYNYQDFKKALTDKSATSSISIIAYKDYFVESATLYSYADYCIENGVKMITIGNSGSRLDHIYNYNNKDGVMSMLDLGDNLELILDSGVLSSGVADQALVFASLDSINDPEALKSLLISASQAARNIVISIKFNNQDNFVSAIANLKNAINTKDYSHIFCESVEFKQNNKSSKVLLASYGDSDGFSDAQISKLANDFNLSLDYVKQLASQSQTAGYDGILSLI